MRMTSATSRRVPIRSPSQTMRTAIFEKDKKTGARAQVWKLDEDKRVATLVYNVDLGRSLQMLRVDADAEERRLQQVSGWVPTLYGRTVETDKDGKILFAIDVQGAIVYRSFRVDDMYSAPSK